MLRTLCILFLFTTGAQLMAQSDSTALATDRPTQTASAFIVPKGSVQIETGFAVSRTKLGFNGISEVTAVNTVFNSTQVRFGVSKNLELLFSQSIVKDRVKGFGPGFEGDTELIPTALGARIRLFDMNEKGRPQMALLATVGGGLLSDLETGTTVDIRANFQHNLGGNFSLGYNVGVNFNDINDMTSGLVTAVVGYQASDKVSLFAEVFLTAPDLEATFWQSDFGILYLVNSNLQVDVFAGLGISDLTPDSLFGAGLSLRIPGK